MAFIPSNQDQVADKMRQQRVMAGPPPPSGMAGPTPPAAPPPNPIEMLKVLLTKALEILSKMGGPGTGGPTPGPPSGPPTPPPGRPMGGV